MVVPGHAGPTPCHLQRQIQTGDLRFPVHVLRSPGDAARDQPHVHVSDDWKLEHIEVAVVGVRNCTGYGCIDAGLRADVWWVAVCLERNEWSWLAA